jgi:membrane-bound lytic murein transglycosylase B
MRFSLILLFILCLVPNGFAKSAKSKVPKMTANKAWVGAELLKMGLSKSFTAEALENYEPQSFHTVVSLNLLGFLAPAGVHMNHVTPEAVAEASKFIKANQMAFMKAQKTFDVPAGVISSLLWIETRHGDDVGDFHTVSVFLHLLQSDLAKNKKALVKLALEKNKNEERFTPKEIRKIMPERTKKKSQWAREQLIALAAIRKQKHLDIKTLRGSYAGAFGLPQFIPSSYREYATSLKPKAVPNLSSTEDAIMSVANYLSESGWENKNKESHVEALMKYNNSRDYADSILEISKKVPRQSSKIRTPSSEVPEEESPTEEQP